MAEPTAPGRLPRWSVVMGVTVALVAAGCVMAQSTTFPSFDAFLAANHASFAAGVPPDGTVSAEAALGGLRASVGAEDALRVPHTYAATFGLFGCAPQAGCDLVPQAQTNTTPVWLIVLTDLPSTDEGPPWVLINTRTGGMIVSHGLGRR